MTIHSPTPPQPTAPDRDSRGSPFRALISHAQRFAEASNACGNGYYLAPSGQIACRFARFTLVSDTEGLGNLFWFIFSITLLIVLLTFLRVAQFVAVYWIYAVPSLIFGTVGFLASGQWAVQ